MGIFKKHRRDKGTILIYNIKILNYFNIIRFSFSVKIILLAINLIISLNSLQYFEIT